MNSRTERGCLPNLSGEGVLLKPLPTEGDQSKGKSWYRGLKPWQRMNSHYTTSSVRRYVYFRQFRIINDDLDFILSSTYEHNRETFPITCDLYYQPETVERCPKKRNKENLNGTREISKDKKPVPKGLHKYDVKGKKTNWNHPLYIGGIVQRVHPCSVKLMNSSHHSPQTNAGYVRQDKDGNLFQY